MKLHQCVNSYCTLALRIQKRHGSTRHDDVDICVVFFSRCFSGVLLLISTKTALKGQCEWGYYQLLCYSCFVP